MTLTISEIMTPNEKNYEKFPFDGINGKLLFAKIKLLIKLIDNQIAFFI